jgi:hypothetical protein
MKDSKKQSTEASDEYQPPLSLYYKSKKNKKTWGHRLKKLSIIVGILVVICGLGIGGDLLYRHHKSSVSKAKAVAAAIVKPASNSKVVSSTTKYVSNGNDLNLSFMYPSNWSVSPASGHNPNDQPITVTSPLSTLPSSNGKKVVGKVVLQVLSVGTNINALSSTGAEVADASTQFAYTSPTADQDQYPYITFVNLNSTLTTNIPFQMGIITGGGPFTAAQQINNDSLVGLDPIVYTIFYKCLRESCSGSEAVPLSITNSIWQNNPIFKEDQSLLASFEFN